MIACGSCNGTGHEPCWGCQDKPAEIHADVNGNESKDSFQCDPVCRECRDKREEAARELYAEQVGR